jgi:hypothetical protein
MKRYKHNLSNYQLTTADMGQLFPVGCVEALPGDTFQHHTNMLVRVSPLAAPVMHPVTARIHHYFVPNRLSAAFLDNGFDWESFITGGPDGNDAQTIPTITSTGTPKDLLDHFNIPPVPGVEINALPVAAFNLIYNEFYRDQDLVTERTATDTTVPLIAWEKDYFTSSRPWSQKGPEVTVPIVGQAPISGIGVQDEDAPSNNITVRETQGIRTYDDGWNSAQTSSVRVEADANQEFPQIFADLSQATGADINDVRRAFAIQRYQEARARYGSRYTEYLRYLGAYPQDSRLQRPEFLGGGTTQINFSEVMQTAPETGTPPSTEFGVGDMYGHGIAALRSNKYRRTIPEHGFIISLCSIRPKSIYTQGIHRSWLRQNKEDYFQKELQHIGQQAVLNNEVYADATNGQDTWGYQDRYMDYRTLPSGVSGDFRTTLDYWHMGRIFSSPPALNASFVECDATKRIHNVQTEDVLWIMVQNKCLARRIVEKSAMARIY